MPSTSLRRSRATQLYDEDEDDEVSRQSNPASTAPHDGKRARRSRIDEDSDDDGNRMSDSDNISSQLQTQFDRKPLAVNGVHPTKPKHQPGAIVRVKLTNFVTYTSAEFFPGPNLNMVIGPNGTGKSTLVCAICLGLGWGTQYLGRAKDATEFVKHGCREATIEIELQRALKGKLATVSNPVITRTITRAGNKNLYTLNGKTATGKVVMELAKSFDIQIDNLCQFLPQDKVVEFAQMTPVEILQSTQRAAAPPHMLEWHEHLKDLRRARKESNDSKKSDRDALANLEHRQEMQRTEVERLRERAEIQKRLGWLHKCRPVTRYIEAKLRKQEAKDRQKSANAELKRLTEESGPTLRKVEAKRVYTNEVQGHKERQEKDFKTAVIECDRIAKSIERLEAAMKECDLIEESEKKSVAKDRADMNRLRVSIASLNKQKEQAPEPFDSRAMNQEIQDLVNQKRELENRVDEAKIKALDLRKQGASRTTRLRQLEDDLAALSTEAGRQEEALKSKSIDAYRAWDWIKKNRNLFAKEVFGPPMVECTLKDPSMANRVESTLQQNDFRIFTVQCKEDFKLLQKELNGTQRLHDVSIRTCPFTTMDSFKPPLSVEQMQQFGLSSWAINHLEGPPTVLAMLCQEKFLHQCAMTDTDITQAQHDQLSVIPGVKSYVSKIKSYQFVRRAEYGAAGVHARERPLRRAEIWSNQLTDSGRGQQMDGERREVLGDIQQIKTQMKTLKEEVQVFEDEKKTIEEKIEALRIQKDDKQKALTEYNSLDTKIAQASEKLGRYEDNLDSMKTRLAENTRKRDKAMFAKADTVFKYCEAVHRVQEITKFLVEAEVAYIEASNDFEVLRQRNDHIAKMVEAKRKEVADAAQVVATESQLALELVEEVKKLQEQGTELEETQNDRSLTALLAELSRKKDPRDHELDDMIKVEEAKLALTEGGDINTIKEFEERAKKIEQLRTRLANMNAKQQELLHAIRELRSQWESPLDALVAKISDAFGDSFARIGCAGQVVVYKASSDDPADCSDELGGTDNGLDFASWAIHISVKFRENEPLSLLDSHRQSGGERAVSTIFYLMALQSLSRAPFRVVDEINQGMDPHNERMVHGRMVDMAGAGTKGGEQGSQYFLITPKLLSGLKYTAGMTVLCIVSGENMPSAVNSKVRDDTGQWVTKAGHKIDFVEFARTARQLRLGRGGGGGGGGGLTDGTVKGKQILRAGGFDTLGRSQTVVGA